MSDVLHEVRDGNEVYRLVLPFSLPEMIDAWDSLRSTMTKRMAPEFTRNEWAYLIGFTADRALWSMIHQSVGIVGEGKTSGVTIRRILRPRGPVALWLPNNVSLLGPLMMIMVSLTGNSLRIKKGSHAADLAGAFHEYIVKNSKDTVLGRYFSSAVTVDHFPRGDERQKELARQAAVRIVFGSDRAADLIHAMPHPADSIGFSFVDRRSEAWIERGMANDSILTDLIRVFAIYGKSGCTSPGRVLLLDHSYEEALEVRDRLCALWPGVAGKRPEIHQASDCIMAAQWAAANGWEPALATGHGAVFAVGTLGSTPFGGWMALPLIPTTLDRAVAHLPGNLQTVGAAFPEESVDRLLEALMGTRVRRIVSIARMHHFGSPWDGWDFLRQLFEEVAVAL